MIYFDYGATTPIDEQVLDAYIRTQKLFFANTSSAHKLGQEANRMLEKASQEILETFGLKNHRLVYTSNATEANNLGLLGVAHQYPLDGKTKWRLITSKIEHPSVFEVFRQLEAEGYDVIYLDVDSQGVIKLDQLRSAMNKQTVLVSVMWVNNIVGSIQPISEIIEIMKDFPKAALHMDAVQGLCKVVPDFDLNDIDLFSFSTHKIYGPKGIGFLCYRNTLELSKRLFGSSAQFGIKPGTLDLALAVATCKAVKIYFPAAKAHSEQVRKLNLHLREGLKNLPGIYINSSLKGTPYICSLSIPDINSETVLHGLEADEIYVSSGSACSSKQKKPEKTVFAMTDSLPLSTSTIRISLSHLTTLEEIGKLIAALGRVCHV